MYQMPENTEGKIFITKAGYVIPFDSGRRGQIEYCPGTNGEGKTAYQFGLGWYWLENGTINLPEPWNKDLEIVGEYHYAMTLPEGYKWKDGFPKLEEVKVGDAYLAYDSNLIKSSGGPTEVVPRKTIGQKRIILEKISTGVELKDGWWITQSGFAVEIRNTGTVFSGIINGWSYTWNSDGSNNNIVDENIIGECPRELIPALPLGYEWVGGHPKFVRPEVGDVFLNVLKDPETRRNNGIDLFEYGAAGTRRILIKPIVSKEDTVAKTRPLEAGKIYLTKGGWLVRINSVNEASVFLDSRTSPGITKFSCLPVDKISRASENNGWRIDNTGSKPEGIDISDELEITNEYTGKLNSEFPDPPKGYKWKHGFPKFTTKEDGEAYYNQFAGNVLSGKFSVASGGVYLTLVPAEPEKLNPTQESFEKLKNIITSGSNGGTLDLVWGSSEWVCSDGEIKTFNLKEEEMKKETAIAVSKSVGSFAWKTINYLFLETATEIGRRIGRSIRYAVFFGTLATGVGFWVAPEKTTAIIKSCLPKISISIDAPEIVR